MEYVQTVLVQIAATKVDEASGPQGLLSELEAHRDFASAQRGFLGMRITRTANPEGNVLVVTETRWSNNNAMADYSALKNNAASIIGRHESETVPASLQVHRMESLKSEHAESPNRMYDRLALPLLIPIGVLAFALLVIYALSRIYLILPSDAATPMAAAIAIGILLIAWYFSSNPSVPRWQIAGVGVLVLGSLAVAGTAAAVYDDNNHEVKVAEGPQPTAAVGAQPTPGPAGAPVIDMEDNKFVDADGNELSTVSITGAGTDVTISVNNKGTAIHNVHVAASGSFEAAFCKANGPAPCTKPASVPAGSPATLLVNLPAGSYDFRCDFHPDQMKGKLEVK